MRIKTTIYVFRLIAVLLLMTAVVVVVNGCLHRAYGEELLPPPPGTVVSAEDSLPLAPTKMKPLLPWNERRVTDDIIVPKIRKMLPEGRKEVVVEYVLPDRTRVDIMTRDMVWEVDFCWNWAEGIGQALHYSDMTNKQGGVFLIVPLHAKSQNGMANLVGFTHVRQLIRCAKLCVKHGLEFSVIPIDGRKL